ncbi:D-glucuronyl C5-epimerase family protein [Geomonas azotofigens]|uniref:D-glucuronyl C5-epimerase family protein n=1 Tax=Geomonas azotofigens TaxID=2843196 RepID=UPI001C124470|nr:D-glucuronyl C5-epimerase family protein [Geomonas azotofigens]MBU5613380.1 D-glucuronyl C5-epimerase family protein [Geomonas azotofigens]
MHLEIGMGLVSRDADLGDYYLDFSNTTDEVGSGFYGPIDRDGVPLVDYDKLFSCPGVPARSGGYGVHYTPVTIAQYGLGLYSRHLKQENPGAYRLFLAQADWHSRNLGRTPGGWGVWLHPFDFPLYDLRAPWVSAMAQGQGISLLLRAFQASGEERYLEAARLAFDSFGHDLLEGGVSRRDATGDVWLEEYPTDPACHVLNGFIFALWGVLDYFRATGERCAGDLYRECSATLSRNMHRYQGVFWSKYDVLTGDNVSRDYHLIHIMQLKVMAQLNGDATLAETAQRWEGYARGNGWLLRTPFRCLRGVMRRVGLCRPKGVRGVNVTQPVTMAG